LWGQTGGQRCNCNQRLEAGNGSSYCFHCLLLILIVWV